jgi:hypothetical protein
MDRAKALERWGATCLEKGELPRIATSCYDNLISEILRGCITAALQKIERPPLALATWIRERVYDLLGLCQTGTEFLDGYSSAIETAFQNSYCSFDMFRETITVLASSEPNTSYRNPISLEKILLDITNALWKTAAKESEAVLLKLESKLPVVEYGALLEPPEDGMAQNTGTSGKKATTKKPSARGTAKPKKTGESGTSAPAKPRAKPRAKKSTEAADMG